jgi:hypothetical protein
MSDSPYAPPVANLEGPGAADRAPALWNPGVAASWSVIFSAAFGAYIHMKNWQAMGEPEKAATQKNWMITILVFFAVIIGGSVFLPDSRMFDGLSRIIGFALLIGWYFGSGRQQMRYVKNVYGKEYPRRSFGKPLAYTLLIYIGVIIVAGLLGGIAGYLSAGAE